MRKTIGRTSAILAAIFVGAIFYVQPLHIQNVATLQDVGLRYLWRQPAILVDADAIKKRLTELGLMDSAKRLRALAGISAKSDHSNKATVGRFEPGAPVEDAAARLALPETIDIPGLTSAPGWHARVASLPLDAEQFDTWTRSHGDIYSSKYASANQINEGNVGQLELAWSIDTAEEPGGLRRSTVQTNPIFADGKVISTTPEWAIVAIDARSGKLDWAFRAPEMVARRGLIHWPGDERHGSRIYGAIGDNIVALDAETGRRIPSFGDDGFVHTGETLVAPLIHDGTLIVAANAEPVSSLMGLELDTGRILWSVDLHDRDVKFSGASVWAGMSLDPVRNMVFLSTGNPRPVLYGVSRPGDNKNSSSVIGIDIAEHKLAWAFQETRHDLWDFDIPSPPVLTTITIDDTPMDVVIAVSKIGNVLMLERDSGQPVFDFRLSRAPVSTVPGEETSPYQPDPEIPEPLIKPQFTPDDISQVDAEASAEVRFQLENALFGRFVPPAIGQTLVTFGLHGGAEWPGAAVDHTKGLMFVTENMIPWKLRLYLSSTGAAGYPGGPGKALYASKCRSCHGRDRNGRSFTEGEADVVYIPSLNGITLRPATERFFTEDYFRHRHQYADVGGTIGQPDLDELWSLFESWDAAVLAAGDFHVNSQWSQLLDHQGRPGSRPPWGGIFAVDLSTGKRRWFVPFGQVEFDGQMREVGAPNYGGLIATAGNLVFATGTADRLLRAYNASTGELLWSYQMAAAGSAPPTTYMMDGVQYVTVVASGGRFHNYDVEASVIYTFRLPRDAGSN